MDGISFQPDRHIAARLQGNGAYTAQSHTVVALFGSKALVENLLLPLEKSGCILYTVGHTNQAVLPALENSQIYLARLPMM